MDDGIIFNYLKLKFIYKVLNTIYIIIRIAHDFIKWYTFYVLYFNYNNIVIISLFNLLLPKIIKTPLLK